LTHRFISKGPESRSGEEVTLNVEIIVNGSMQAEEALRGSGRLEALHLPLSSSDYLV
jgi:hypothetical protein